MIRGVALSNQISPRQEVLLTNGNMLKPQSIATNSLKAALDEVNMRCKKGI
jgi:hypothetical protein